MNNAWEKKKKKIIADFCLLNEELIINQHPGGCQDLAIVFDGAVLSVLSYIAAITVLSMLQKIQKAPQLLFSYIPVMDTHESGSRSSPKTLEIIPQKAGVC